MHLHLPKTRRGDAANLSTKVKDEPIAYFGTVALGDVRFIVSQAGRARTLAKRQRNVHAWVEGDVLSTYHGRFIPEGEWRQAKYNPFVAGSFLDSETGEELHSCHTAILSGKSVYYK